MQILVQKFGGSSLGTKESRMHVKDHIKEAIKKNHKVIAVVSALGRKPAPYATDSLLNLINYPAAHSSDREVDLLLSCGETISAVVLSNELKQIGIKAIALTGAQAGIITNENHTNAKIKYVDTKRLIQALHTYDAVVVAGFQGQSLSGEITTIGRGGSDTTAAALGAATEAVRADIFTDVEGIMTADPKIVHTARPLKSCTYTEICHLAYQGAKVIHPQAVEIAMQAKLPLQIRSTYQKNGGTQIAANKQSDHLKSLTKNPITGIAHMTGIAQVKISKKNNPSYSLTAIFKALAENGISIDFINISPHQTAFTLPNSLLESAQALFKRLNIHADILKNCAKVSAVGAGMNGMPGIAAKIVTALAKKDIQILQAADSHTTIWVLIHEKDLKPSVNALHDAFRLGDLVYAE